MMDAQSIIEEAEAREARDYREQIAHWEASTSPPREPKEKQEESIK